MDDGIGSGRRGGVRAASRGVRPSRTRRPTAKSPVRCGVALFHHVRLESLDAGFDARGEKRPDVSSAASEQPLGSVGRTGASRRPGCSGQVQVRRRRCHRRTPEGSSSSSRRIPPGHVDEPVRGAQSVVDGEAIRGGEFHDGEVGHRLSCNEIQIRGGLPRHPLRVDGEEALRGRLRSQSRWRRLRRPRSVSRRCRSPGRPGSHQHRRSCRHIGSCWTPWVSQIRAGTTGSKYPETADVK